MLDQLTLDQMEKWVRVFAQKIDVMRIQTQCSACHVYVEKMADRCPHCGAAFVEG